MSLILKQFTTGINTGKKWSSYWTTLNSSGNGTGVATLSLLTSSNVIINIDGDANFYTNAEGTEGESKTFVATLGVKRTIYLKCTAGTSVITFKKINKITEFYWSGDVNAPLINLDLAKLSIVLLDVRGNSILTGAMPSSLLSLTLQGSLYTYEYEGALPEGLVNLYIFNNGTTGLNWKYNGALPAGLLYCMVEGAGLNWTYNGAMPSNLVSLGIQSNDIVWTYNGALPEGLTYLYLGGLHINWTYTGAMPQGLLQLRLDGDCFYWTYDGALPEEVSNIYLNGTNINWTGLDIGSSGMITYLLLNKFRQIKMSSNNMIDLLTQIKNDVGALPSEITINDYADDANPTSDVIDAINALMVAKSISNVHLGAYNVSDIPSITSAIVDANDTTKVVITLSKSINESFVPATSAFTIPTKTISNVSVSGTTITLTVTIAFDFNDTPTVSYVKPATNWIRSTNNGLLGSFTDRSVSNPLIPSYSNAGGTGDRTGIITVTSDATITGTLSKLVNGTIDSAMYFNSGVAVTGKYLKFDFGVAKLITEIRSYNNNQDQYTNDGYCKIQGSNNNTDWTDITSEQKMYGTTVATGGHLYNLSANSTGYRYYRFLGTSGNGTGRYHNEIEFKIANI